MKRTDKLVSSDGGKLSFIGYDGEVLMVLAVPPGVVDASVYIDLCPVGVKIEVDGGLWLASPAVRSGVIVSNAPFESAADVDFIPASAAEQMQRDMLRRLDSLSKVNERLLARERAAFALGVPRGSA